jgi:citrate lyase beta subunit
MPDLQTARSLLFAPGDDERKLVRALSSGADAVIADLEDAVADVAKADARSLSLNLLAQAPPGGSLRLVRVNGHGTTWHDDDLEAVIAAGLDGVVLPKATPEAARAVAVAGLPVVAIVETAAGLRTAYETATCPGVVALMLGAVDLALELRTIPRADAQELLFARSSLVVDSAAAGLRPPIDRVWVDVRDASGLAEDCALARTLGFRGKACIHPGQVAVVADAFGPSDAEVARAHAIVAAYDEAVADGRGVVALDGEMIDVPVVERARELLTHETRSTSDDG